MVDRTSLIDQGPIFPPPSAPPTGGQGRRRWTWLVAACIAVALVVTTAGVVFVLFRGDDPNPAQLAGPDKTRSVVPAAKIGVFRGTDRAQVDEFQTWLGGKVDYVVDFSTRQTWEDITNPAHMIEQWKGAPYRPVYSVAMLPDGDPGATIESGAAGNYDGGYVQLAQRLVDAGQQDAILRIGWEFNLEGSRWSSDDPKAWITYWRHIVNAMRSVPGQAFQFDWNPNNGKNPHDAVEFYPGDDYVDYVGVDAYDTSWGFDSAYPYPENCDDSCRLERQKEAWAKSIYGGARGLRFWSKFARHQGKPMSLPEWGLWNRPDAHGGGDNAYYLEQMAAFIKNPANDVAYQAYFEWDADDGQHRLMTTFADRADLFRKLFVAQP